jgi:hypothetical protein
MRPIFILAILIAGAAFIFGCAGTEVSNTASQVNSIAATPKAFVEKTQSTLQRRVQMTSEPNRSVIRAKTNATVR